MSRTKQSYCRAPPSDPHMARLQQWVGLGDCWVSPPSVINAKTLDKIRMSGLGQYYLYTPTLETTKHTLECDQHKSPQKVSTRNLKKRERALCQCLARGGTIGDATLLIMLGGQSFVRPTHPSPTSRSKGKAATSNSDDSSSKVGQPLDITRLVSLLPTDAWPVRIGPGKILVHNLTCGLQVGLQIRP
uniref:Uncharacterized protein n=1 Tax=Cannabis sativa TaxID=3483 RepID=A0A803PKW3_CANSA